MIVEGAIKRESDNAIMLVLDNVDEVWFPLSQVEKIHRSKDGRGDYLIVSDWIARKKNLL